MRLFVAELFKTVKDPDTKKDTLQILQTHYRTKDPLPFNVMRNDSQLCMKIFTEDKASDNETLKFYKQQYLNANDALFVVKELAENK